MITRRNKRPGSDDAAKNKIKAVVAQTAKTVAFLGAYGSLMQTFLAMLGFAPELIYVHSSFLQAANVITMLVASGFAKGENSMKRAAVSVAPAALLFFLYIPVAISRNATAFAYIALVSVGVVQQIFIALYTVCEYKIPYYVYNAEEYGRILSICGIVASVFSILTSSLISSLAEKYDYLEIMTWVFALCALLLAVAAVSTGVQRSLYKDSPDEKNEERNGRQSSVLKLFSNPVFYKLIHANLLRGFSIGVISVLATVALDVGFTEKVTTKMVPIESVAMLISCALFSITAKKIPTRLVLLFGCSLLLLMPAMLVNNGTVFLSVYFVIIFARTLIDYSVPAMLIRIVPVEMAGPYNAWRIALQNAGTLIATSVAAFLPIPALLIIAAVFKMISGISFYRVEKSIKSKKAKKCKQ